MTEAANCINDHAFDDLNFELLYFGNAVTSIASRRIREKTGAVLIGTKSMKFVDPTVHESEIWKLTKEDWSRFRYQGQGFN